MECREPRHVYRVGKIDFPRFTNNDVSSCLYQVEHYFEIDGTPEEAKLKLTAIHLQGEALQWHQEYMRVHSVRTWSEYVDVLHARFGDKLFGDPILEMKSLHQDHRFDNLINKVKLIKRITERSLINKFNRGLESYL